MNYDLNKRAEQNEKTRAERLADYRASIAALESQVAMFSRQQVALVNENTRLREIAEAARELVEAMYVADTYSDVHEELGWNPDTTVEEKRLALDRLLARYTETPNAP